jgi:hypothetical protein
VIAQANAQWRQNITLTNTAAQNEANAEKARAMNGMTAKAIDEVWQRERDTLSYAFTAYQNDADRTAMVLLADKRESLEKYKVESEADADFWSGVWNWVTG